MSDTTFLDDIVLSHCVSSPSKLAIRFKDKKITYAELGAAVNSLAQHLIDNGVQSGDFVVVLLAPSEHIIFALLAISRVGAIYTPLDPTHPDSQLEERYKSTKAVCTITQQQHVNRVKSWAKKTLIIEQLEILSKEKLEHIIFPQRNIEAPACIFFTSGTTGKAKGVLGSAKAMRDAIVAPTQSLQFTDKDTLNSIARYAWSISMLELLAALSQGGTTLILEPKQALDLDWLKTQVESCTAFHCPPALLRKFANHIQQNYPNNNAFANLRLVWYGGDTFAPSHIDTLHSVFPHSVIGTAYGCTEIFGLSHIYFYSRQKIEKVLIGKPVPSIEQLVCDEDYKPVKAGQQGEILLAGDRLASEYWQAPETNAEKFITLDNTKYFQTGDYAYLHDSGDLEFLQRKDSQVKIRGIRIELGEIEHNLNEDESVQEAVVLAVGNAAGDKELRAYIVLNDHSANIDTLKNIIKQNLPDYMMPAQWLLLKALPVTENFKVDRKALAELDIDNEQKTLLDGIAGQIAEVWQEITKSTPTSEKDNFFESGGDSLAVIQLAVKLGQKFNTKIEVADVYRNPTLLAQVNIVNKNHKEIESTAKGTTVYATQGQVGLFFREMLGHKGHSITCTRYVFSQDDFNEQIVKKALMFLLERFPTLKTNIKISRPNLELIENKYSTSDIEFIRLQKGWSLEPKADLFLTKNMHKFDILKSPLICAIVTPMKEGGEILQLTGHHIACDDNSLGRITKEFVALYDSYKTGKQISLPEITENYSEFAQQQFNDIASGAYSERAKTVADRLFEALPECQNNPLLVLNKTKDISSAHFEKYLKHDYSHAVFSHYIAALSWAFYHACGRTHVVFCAHSAMRRDSDNSPTVGMYINLLPVITGYDPTHSITQHIQRTTADFNHAMSLSDIPYEVILDENDSLKKIKKFPFDAFINELSFVEEFVQGYENVVVQETFATNTNEMNVTVVETLEGKFLHLESPSVDNIETIHDQVFDLMSEFLLQI
ncbi:MAG: AMP-binding protein [Woeseiaceae bacterium]